MKVLLINQLITDYRLPIFNLLGEKVDLTVAHSGKVRIEKGINFKQLIIPKKNIGPFIVSSTNLHKLCEQYDVIISDGNIRYIDRNFLMLNPFKSYKWINWGIGVSASYDKQFDQDTKFDFIRNLIFKRADAQVFYTDYPVQKYVKAGFDPESLFVANNTTFISFDTNKSYQKYKLLFVGTLYKQKKIYELLNAYLQYSKTNANSLPLDIIGNGDEYDNIKNWIAENKLETKITLHGAIFDQEVLQKYFREAFACISPGQAGLSVLTSMGYGTPFITKKDAITGGEIFNISHNNTGVVYENSSELVNILKDIDQKPEKYIQMGQNAREFYLQYRKPEQMVEGLFDACLFVNKD